MSEFSDAALRQEREHSVAVFGHRLDPVDDQLAIIVTSADRLAAPDAGYGAAEDLGPDGVVGFTAHLPIAVIEVFVVFVPVIDRRAVDLRGVAASANDARLAKGFKERVLRLAALLRRQPRSGPSCGNASLRHPWLSSVPRRAA